MKLAGARAVVVVAGLLSAAGCEGRAPTAVIGYTVAPSAGVQRAIQGVMDSTHREGSPRIVLAQATPPDRNDNDPYLINAVRNALDLAARPEVVATVGPSGSQDAMLVGPVYRDAGLAFVMPTANIPQLSALGPTAFPLAPGIDEEASLIAEFAAGRLGARAVAVLYHAGPWGIALQSAVTSELWMRGVRVTGRFPVPAPEGCQGDGPRRDYLAASVLRAGRPDVVVLATYNQQSQCLVAAFRRLVADVVFIAGDATVLSQPFVRALGPARDRFHAVTFWRPTGPSRELAAFRAVYETLNGRSPTYDEAATFDAAMVLAHAIREVGPDRAAVVRYLGELGRRRPAYHGVTGTITFDGRRSGRLSMQAAAAVPAGGV